VLENPKDRVEMYEIWQNRGNYKTPDSSNFLLPSLLSSLLVDNFGEDCDNVTFALPGACQEIAGAIIK
jgi:hypothetical protein